MRQAEADSGARPDLPSSAEREEIRRTTAPQASDLRARATMSASSIRELHAANHYAYGYRKVWLALQRHGEQVGRDGVKP